MSQRPMLTDWDAFVPLWNDLWFALGPQDRRDFTERGESYHEVLRTVFAVRFRDAQCGFKAVRTDIARHLLPAVEDNGWFFDTELLLLAEHNGLRVHEVPVDWVDDPDSRVNVRRTATDDLKGMAAAGKSAVERAKEDLAATMASLKSAAMGRLQAKEKKEKGG